MQHVFGAWTVTLLTRPVVMLLHIWGCFMSVCACVYVIILYINVLNVYINVRNDVHTNLQVTKIALNDGPPERSHKRIDSYTDILSSSCFFYRGIYFKSYL